MPPKKTRPSSSRRQSPQRPNPSYLSTEASWHAQARRKGKSTVLATERRLREGLKLVRRLYSGFTPADGFDARHLQRIPAKRIALLNEFIAEANRLTSGEFHTLYTLHRSRTEAQREALELHTNLRSLDDRRHPMRAYPVYANTRQVKVRYVPEQVPVFAGFGVRELKFETRLRVEIRRPVKGMTLVHRDYVFREVLGFQPGIDSTTPEGMRVGRQLGTYDPWVQMLLAMKHLLPRLPSLTPKGNEAHYRLLSDRGPIGTSYPKHMLLQKMQDWAQDYGTSQTFVGLLTGVRYQGDEFKAVRGMQSLDAIGERRRARYQALARKRDQARGRVRKKKSRVKRRKAPGKHK